MCGIAGFVADDPTAPVARSLLERMVGQLRDRGPDGQGYHAEPGVGLGHARLSIIDIETGAQPLANEAGTVWVSFNGEIFNYLELRATLVRQGHQFSTRSDTEVIVHLYEEYGEDFAHHLNGQFAIALWDRRRQRLLLVRDRPGILPLYFARGSKGYFFASEIKALLEQLPEKARTHAATIEEIFTFWGPLGPDTPFAGVTSVLPGEMVSIERGVTRRWRWWDWAFPADGAYHQGDPADLARALHDLLLDATRLRLRADVPVGAYLSGGLDSSAVAALAVEAGRDDLRTFSVTFDDPGLDERAFQAQVQNHLGTRHTGVHCLGSSIAELLPRVIERTEHPILRTAPAPLCLLSGHVHSAGYKVVLTGEGADEVLGGYDLFKEAKIRRFWAAFPESVRRPRLLERLYPWLGLGDRMGLPYLKQFFGQGLDHPETWDFSHQLRWQTGNWLREFLLPEHRRQSFEAVTAPLQASLPADFDRWHPFNRAQYLEARTLLAGYLLSSQGDRMLMANGVEGRFPFLDHRVIEFAARLHPRYKMRGLNEKYLLKQAVAQLLPRDVLARPKQPYRAPDASAFLVSGELPAYARDHLSSAALRASGLFDPVRVGLLLRKLSLGRQTSARENQAFVGILSTQLWHRRFIQGQSIA